MNLCPCGAESDEWGMIHHDCDHEDCPFCIVVLGDEEDKSE